MNVRAYHFFILQNASFYLFNGGRIIKPWDLLALLSNNHRFAIVEALLDAELSISELCKMCNLSRVAIAPHLTKLRIFGILKSRKKGVQVYYSLTSDTARSVVLVMQPKAGHPNLRLAVKPDEDGRS